VAPSDVYGDDAVTMLSALVELSRSGIEPRHLRGVRSSVERDLGLVENALSSVARRRDAAGRARVAELSREITEQLDVVRGALLRTALERLDT
jgi:hypothetical protein